MVHGSPSVRVLHVIPWVTSGGVERRRLELARALDPSRFEQRVVCLNARDTLQADFEKAGVSVLAIGGTGSPFDWRSIWRVAQEARTFRPHIIHGAVFEGVTLASLAGRLARVPRVVIEEISDGEHRTRRAQQLFRLYALAANECVAVSEYAKQQLVDTGIAPERVRVIVNGVSTPTAPTAEAAGAARAAWNIADTDIVIVTIGRLHNEHKRISDLIEAVALVRRSEPRIRLLVVGGGNELESLQEHARRHGVSESVSFVGYQPDVGLPLALADVFALASARESFGLVAVEAMLAGLPVVASAVGGLREIVADAETGFLVPPFQPARLADALARLCEDRALRQRLGAAGKLRARARFSAERYVADVTRLYDELSYSCLGYTS